MRSPNLTEPLLTTGKAQTLGATTGGHSPPDLRHHFYLLLGWIAIAGVLRFTNLTAKAVWSDEFSTLVFSLGNSFLTIPSDRALSLAELLQPLQVNPAATAGTVIHHLLQESNHPPLYFVLNHWWLSLFAPVDGWVSIWAARALSALFGVWAVPAIFGLSRVMFRSWSIAHLAALLMALSPFGIYLAQEARHYTLATLWIIASLTCMIAAVRWVERRRSVPWTLCFTWIGVNTLGIATHYFVGFALLSEAIALLGVGWLQIQRFDASLGLPAIARYSLGRFGAVLAGTLAGAVVWLPALIAMDNSELTNWIQQGDLNRNHWFTPSLRTVAGWLTMVYLLPVQKVPLPVLIAAGLVLGAVIVWTVWLVYRGLKFQYAIPENRLTMQVLGGFVGSGVALSLVLTYGFNVDVASVFRYQFFYFPGVLVLVAAGLASAWTGGIAVLPNLPPGRALAKRAIALLTLFSLLGSITVITNGGYQKTHRPDVVATAIQQKSSLPPTLIAIPHRNHAQTGRLMGIAWALHQQNMPALKQTRFLLAHQAQRDPRPAVAALQHTLATLPRPLDVWRVNFRSDAGLLAHTVLAEQHCDPQSKLMSVDGYRYQHYYCQKPVGRTQTSEVLTKNQAS